MSRPEYEDILEGKRQYSDLGFSMEAYDPPRYKHCKPRAPEKVKEDVLNSTRVLSVIEQLATETDQSEDDLLSQARAMVEEMGHNLRMRSIRFFAYFLNKIFKALYKRIYVNGDDLEKLAKMSKDQPVLLLPSHRSYIDFLMLSYVAYCYDFPLPVIAAGADFMGMKFVGTLLRNCGAFFMRRSFGSDRLYWAVFTEYVQTLIRNGDSPMEFFVEGTRSRTSKSLSPKFGLLSAAIEPFLTGSVYDITVVPISISYDRRLEETLYARELLGIPKPKESTSGLVKARSVLQENYGNIHVCFGEPLSVRKLAEGRIDRSIHGLHPRHMSMFTSEEHTFVQHLAHQVILAQQKYMVISPWSLVAAVLSQHPQGLLLKKLVHEVVWLKKQAVGLGAFVNWPAKADPSNIVKSALELHHHVVTLGANGRVVLNLPTPTRPKMETEMARKHRLMEEAEVRLMVVTGTNQLLHVFVRVALVLMALSKDGSQTRDELFRIFGFLRRLLEKDFIFMPGQDKQDFDTAVQYLSRAHVLEERGGCVGVTDSGKKLQSFLHEMFSPFLLGYWTMCQYLLTASSDDPRGSTTQQLTRGAQDMAATLLTNGLVKRFEILSLDMLGNSITSFVSMGAVKRFKSNGHALFLPVQGEIFSLSKQIETIIAVPDLKTAVQVIPVKSRL
ncbi:dihydroxyacetone phosphate acyltransferase-like [Branchiostoma floridae]|uniref:Dihydroxyacetone phosphate acyltransferase-like n=1 Tax=Branchiostoma floridae TaxID=7739 RepID=A0A9J7KL42_BRAFL|nr:dihydroxyacetone phosphate acyltransferase-like [Branchiostoma floridae]XP_035665138.1 dihydroxyacetone phosphate acyltransferase-like [Branchiostoma floridae]